MNRQTPVDLPQGYIDFFIELENIQNQQQIILTPSIHFDSWDIKKHLASSKRSLIELHGITIDPALYKTVLLSMIDFMKLNRPETKTAMEKLEIGLDELELDHLIAKLIAFDIDAGFTKLAEEVNLTQELLIFTFEHALRPFLRIYAQPYLQELLKDNQPFWPLPNICPVCGSKSSFSRVSSSDNRRYMFCDRCFSEWETRFLQCVHCGNDNPKSIRYLNVENDDAYQIYVCDKCRGYLKTFDERQNKQNPDMFIANMETVYLDLLAKEKGYTNHDDE